MSDHVEPGILAGRAAKEAEHYSRWESAVDSDCACERDPCRVCGGAGHIYDEDDPETGWQCYECDGTGNAPL